MKKHLFCTFAGLLFCSYGYGVPEGGLATGSHTSPETRS